MADKPHGDWIETVSGIQFPFIDPQIEHVNIKDIAHALSLNCRFVGQCSQFYSIAEHSWHVARLLDGTPLSVQLAGLLHDGSEAYLTDIASPVKAHLPDYKVIEDNIHSVIFRKYGLEFPMHPAVKQADLTMLSTEAHYLMPGKGNNWDTWKYIKRPPVMAGYKPIGMGPDTAKQLFMDKFFELSIAIREERTSTSPS